MATHSSTFAWKIPWTEEPGRLQSMGLLESDMTEQLHFHFSLSCIGEGNSNPLQCSCLEIHRDGGAWWADVHGVAQSRTRLKRQQQQQNSPLDSLKCLGAIRTGFPGLWTSLVAQLVKNLPAMQETWVQFLDWEDPPEKGNATYSSILAWRILYSPWGHKESDITEQISLYFSSLDCTLDTWRRLFVCVCVWPC